MTRPRLTPHQRSVLNMIRRTPPRWVASRYIGSRGACQHLVRKGYVEEQPVIGPRGGTTWFYRAVADRPVCPDCQAGCYLDVACSCARGCDRHAS